MYRTLESSLLLSLLASAACLEVSGDKDVKIPWESRYWLGETPVLRCWR